MSRNRLINIAAIQMCAELADVRKNLLKTEALVRQAAKQGAEWVVLPEFFTSACAFHPKMHESILPIDGIATELLERLANELNIVIGGSFLAQHEKDVFNTFILMFPDGACYQHNKDIPTMWENCYYIGDDQDDGVITTKTNKVGVALCWEMLRTQTANRLLGNVEFVLSGSCWWNLPESAPESFDPLREQSLSLLRETPTTFAKLLGVPVVHAGHAGEFEGYAAPSEKKKYKSHYLGETMIVDSDGQVLERLSYEEGDGVVVAEINLGKQPYPSLKIPEGYWIPDMPKAFLSEWGKQNQFGSKYYKEKRL